LEFIIFDLDNTLYRRGSGVMEEIGRRIQLWLCQALDLSWEEASALRRDYLHQHGTTMGGLMAEHAVDIPDYLAFVHDIPIEEYLNPDEALREMLEQIPVRKAVYTNATSAHAQRVLRALDIRDAFERIIGIEEVDLHNKFNRRAYERMLALLDVEGEACVMVEDSPRNLPPAKAVGMTTILVDGGRDERGRGCRQDVVDFVVEDILGVEPVVRRILAGDEGHQDPPAGARKPSPGR
jgi:putative hydrolase of the HAD superfamily